jgi:geranylgeranyl pyrophosphate synthase
LAFQIADDLLDGRGADAESARKEENKATYPAVAGFEAAEQRLRDLVRQALKSLAPLGPKADPLRGILLYVAGRALGRENCSDLQEMHG